jgi:asparagine synthase (glutamine-hydrolysing)
MCGITGIVHFDGQAADKSRLKKMTDILSHRGPDGEGYWYSEEENIGLGHRRLAIIDLSPEASQPMVYQDRFVITLNGEIYNYLELKEILSKKGYLFQTRSDTEVLLALYSEFRESCLSYLDGMFAFCIYDRLEKTVFCARDRFGEKPFYYIFSQGHSFIFASEIKALLAEGNPFSENLRMVFYFLAYQVVENPFQKGETFFQGISNLEPAHYLKIGPDGSMNKVKYWDLELQLDQPLASPAEAAEKIRELLSVSINRRLRSEVRVGSSLSGGLDSSIIVCSIYNSLSKINLLPQHTFSARFDDPEKDEGRYISKITSSLPVSHNNTWVSGDHFRDDFEKIMWHQEEPIGGASPVAQWEVMKLAYKEGVTVLLDGQGADEVFAGYRHYFRPFFTELFLKNKNRFREEKIAYKALYHSEYEINKSFILEARYPLLIRKLGRFRRKIGIPSYLDDLDPDFANTYKNLPPPFRTFPDLNDTLKFSTLGYGLGKLLKLADRNSMAFSREIRLPYLYHPLVEYLFSLPAHYKIHNGWTKWILRRAFEDQVPEEIIWRKDKQGYEPPLETWMASSWFTERIKDSIEGLKQAGILAKPKKEKEWFYCILYNFLFLFKNQIHNLA